MKKTVLTALLVLAFSLYGDGPEEGKDPAGLFPDGKTFPVLAGRLKVRMPEGAVSSARQESVMAAPEADEDETRLMLIDEEEDMADLVFFIEEFYAFAGESFRDDLVKHMKEISDQIPITLSVKTIKTYGGLDFHMIVPSEIHVDDEQDGIRIRSGYLISADKTVQHASVYISPELAKKDLDGYIKQAENIIMSIAPGERKLDLSGGIKKLETLLSTRKAAIEIPKGWILIKQHGDDFIVNRILSMAEFGKEREASFSIYFGGHPASYDFYKDSRDEDHLKVEEIKGKLAGMDVTWKKYTLKNRKTEKIDYYLQVIHPLDDYWMIDVSTRDESPGEIDKIKKIAETLSIENEDPQLTLLKERLLVLEEMEIDLPVMIQLIIKRVKQEEKLTADELTAANVMVTQVISNLKKEMEKGDEGADTEKESD